MILTRPSGLLAGLLATLAIGLAACSSAPRSVPNGVLVVGAGGQTGKLVVDQLAAEGYTVRAMVRDPARAGVVFPAGVAVVAGDVKDPASLSSALQGMSYVISAVGAKSGQGPDRPEMIDYQGIRNLAEAARAARIKQFVLVSSRAVTHDDNPLNRMFGDVLKWKLKGEDALRASGVPYTVVRPGGLTNAPGRQATVIFDQGDKRGSEGTISRADVADICVQALKYPEARNKTLEASSVGGSPVSNWQGLFANLK